MDTEIIRKAVENLGEVNLRTDCDLIDDVTIYGVDSLVLCVNDFIVCRRKTERKSIGRTVPDRDYVILTPEYWMEYGHHLVDWRLHESTPTFRNELDAIGAAVGMVLSEKMSEEGMSAELSP